MEQGNGYKRQVSDGHGLQSQYTWDILETNLETAMATGLPIIIWADFNDDVLASGGRLVEFCARVGLQVYNEDPTHTTSTSSKCIDVVLTNCAQLLRGVDTTSQSMSHHCGLVVTKGPTLTTKNKYERTIQRNKLGCSQRGSEECAVAWNKRRLKCGCWMDQSGKKHCTFPTLRVKPSPWRPMIKNGLRKKLED